jgi:ribosomal protein S18 acetylase RimI-like enzyme
MSADNVIIRRGKIKDAQDFSSLILISAPIFFPSLFGHNILDAMKGLFQHPKNLFSFEHSYFIEVDGKIAGMSLGYTWNENRQERLYTGLLLMRYLKWDIIVQSSYLLKIQDILERPGEGDYYLSNIAVYPEFRGLGLGTSLLKKMEVEAKEKGCNRIILDVEVDNKRAMRLYERLGYSIEKSSSILNIKGKDFRFFRMRKIINGKKGG